MTIAIGIGDITKIKSQCIVNAAKPSLRGGGGVDGAIHAAAGPKLLEYCEQFEPINVGDVRITPAFDLPAEWVIHTAGPIWDPHEIQKCEIKLAECYVKASLAAYAYGAKSISYPAISTGIYRFPIRDATQIAMKALNTLRHLPLMIKLVCYDSEYYNIYIETAMKLKINYYETDYESVDAD